MAPPPPSLLFLLLILAMATIHSSGSTWCICKEGMSDTVLQKTLDYACGQGGDCSPTKQNGPCFNPNTVRAHCSYAVNSYYQKKAQASGSCDFSGTATLVTSDPSVSGCSYPATASSSTITTVTPGTNGGGSTSTGGSSPGSATPTISTPAGNNNPSVTGPSNGVLGGNTGISNGLGPAGAGLNPDNSMGGFILPNSTSTIFTILLLFFVLFLW